MGKARVRITFKPNGEDGYVGDEFQMHFDQDNHAAYLVYLALENMLDTLEELLVEPGARTKQRSKPR